MSDLGMLRILNLVLPVCDSFAESSRKHLYFSHSRDYCVYAGCESDYPSPWILSLQSTPRVQLLDAYQRSLDTFLPWLSYTNKNTLTIHWCMYQCVLKASPKCRKKCETVVLFVVGFELFYNGYFKRSWRKRLRSYDRHTCSIASSTINIRLGSSYFTVHENALFYVAIAKSNTKNTRKRSVFGYFFRHVR